MASILGIDTIQHQSGTTAITIDSTGRVLTAVRPAFRVKNTNSNEWGQNHSDTDYDTNYHTPIPIFTDATTTTELNVGGGTLSFETHPAGGGGKYLKYVVPVTGLYIFSMQGSIRLQVSGDYASTGFQLNSESEGNSSTFPTQTINGYQAYQADSHMSLAGSAIMDLTAGDFIVPCSTSVAEAYVDSNIPIRITGYLLG